MLSPYGSHRGCPTAPGPVFLRNQRRTRDREGFPFSEGSRPMKTDLAQAPDKGMDGLQVQNGPWGRTSTQELLSLKIWLTWP